MSVIGNIAILLLVPLMLIQEGMPENEEFFMLLLFVIVPISSLITINSLFNDSVENSGKVSNVWPLILFKRLALEEKKKLEKLEKK